MFIEVVLLYTTHMNATGCGIDLKTDNPKLLTKTMKNIFTVCLANHKSLTLDYGCTVMHCEFVLRVLPVLAQLFLWGWTRTTDTR